jgi:hypothetical protein
MGREELLQQFDSEFENLLATIDGLSDGQMTKVWHGEWSVRDILAHAAGWHREEAGMLERMARGERPWPEGSGHPYNDGDAWNARFVEKWHTASPATILEELKASKDAYVAAARLLPEERFREGRTAYRLLQEGCIDHYRDHAAHIREWRKREGI